MSRPGSYGMARGIERFVYGESSSRAQALARTLLAPLGWAFGALTRIRRAMYEAGVLRHCRVAVPVISIGNLTMGGTGKTPLVIWLATEIQSLGLTPGVVTRGYGARRGAAPRLVRGDGDDDGDEAVLVARRCPGTIVVAGRDRPAGARIAIAAGAHVILLDDGFQHIALARDLDLVLLDPRVPPGTGRVLPAGPLREPWSALRRADAVIEVDGPAVGRPGVPGLVRGRRCAVRLRKRGESIEPPGALRGCRTYLLSGIAGPQRFRALVEALGAVVVGEARHPDHHRFSPHDLDRAAAAALANGADLIVTTEKDAARLPGVLVQRDDVVVLEIDLVFDEGEERLRAALHPLLRPAPGWESAAGESPAHRAGESAAATTGRAE